MFQIPANFRQGYLYGRDRRVGSIGNYAPNRRGKRLSPQDHLAQCSRENELR